MHAAAGAGEVGAVELLLEAKGAPLGDRKGITPLHRAAEQGMRCCFEYRMDHLYSGYPPLHGGSPGLARSGI